MRHARGNPCRRFLTAAAALSALLVTVVGEDAASASVSSVSGSAFGYTTSVGLFGGPQSTRGYGQTIPPGSATSASPSVTLPSIGGSVSQTDADGATGAFGPANIFESHGAMTVQSSGTTGATGSVSSSATVLDIQPQDPFTAPAPGGVSSSCTASEAGLSGSATITNGRLVIEDPDPDVSGEPGEVVVTPPTSPAPNTEYIGLVANVNDYYTVVFNEQVTTPDAITVNAVHMYLEGPRQSGT